MFSRSSESTWLLALCLCCVLGAAITAQQPPTTTRPTDRVVQVRVHPLDTVEGPALYREYCLQCHGADGRGRTSPAAAVHVPDLTRIAARNGGTFPRTHVRSHIEGLEPVSDPLVLHAHRPGDMPHWAPLLKSMSRHDPARGPVCIANLVQEIERMQSSQH